MNWNRSSTLAVKTAGGDAPADGRLVSGPRTDGRCPGVTWRVVCLCLALALLFGYAIPVFDYKFSNTFLGATHLPPGAIAALLAMVLVVNPLLRLLSMRLTFSRNETLTVYLSCLFSTLVPGIGGNNYFVSFIIGVFYNATRENQWFEFLKGLPPWMTPALNADGSYNQELVEGWFQGLAPGQSIPWAAWIVPLCAWGLFFAASFAMMACLSVMLRAQWGDNEALAFPLLKLPLALTEGTEGGGLPGLFRNQLVWSGFAVAGTIQLINGLSLYYPDIPPIFLELNTGPYLSEVPWNQIGWTPVKIYPIAVGISYLLTTEVSFSFWFFYWFVKSQLIAAYLLGYMPATLPRVPGLGMAFIGYQEVGANLAYVALIFWMARRHLGHIARRALGREKARGAEQKEALPYPVAFWGFWSAFWLMFAWGVAAGMDWHVSLLLWTNYLVIAVVLSRVVVEGGLLFVHHSWMPLGSWMGLLGGGPGTLLSGGHGLVPAAVMEFSTIQDYRGCLMPSFVQSFKLAHDEGIHARRLIALLAAVILIGGFLALIMNVRLGYENKGLELQAWFSRLGARGMGGLVESYSKYSAAPSILAWTAMGVGISLTLGMVLARARFAWFPFHPLGYIMAFTLPLHHFWFSILLAWTAKSVITRYGGHETARRCTAFFLGLALGDVALMLFWLVVDGFCGRVGHQLMPG